MNKRLGIILIMLSLAFGEISIAQSQFSPVLTKMETSLFGLDYNNQTDEARLKRIEETVYGSASTANMQQRINKLSKDLSVDVIGQEIKPKRDTFEEDEDKVKEDLPKEDKTVNYPIVNNLEKEVFNKDFRGTDINQRLSNLEEKVFRKTFNDDLNTRVDRLKATIIPEVYKSAQNEDSESDYTYLSENSDGEKYPTQTLSPDSLNKTPTGFAAPQQNDYNENNSVLDSYNGSSNIAIPLASVEKMVLRKSYPDDTVPNRLSRLEARVFNSTFADDDAETRLDRVASAYQAKKSSKRYDNNKFSQNMATAMQVGAFLLMILACIL